MTAWSLQGASDVIDNPDKYNDIHAQINYHAEKRYNQYLPTIGPHPDFDVRLKQWLDSVASDEDQQLLFQLIPHIFFVAREEFSALYRSAFHGPIFRWIVQQSDIMFDDEGMQDKVIESLHSTWFCPITDSMQIADFYHANNIEGIDLRPDWQSLGFLGSEEKIICYMADHGMNRLVLLEDFVGSGNQMRKAVRFAASLRTNIPILLLPLICCPSGVIAGMELAAEFPNVQFSPLLTIPESEFIKPYHQESDTNLFIKLRLLIVRLCQLVCECNPIYWGCCPFGYRCTGGLIVLYSNCPNNTLPIIHSQSEYWSPLFPRSWRVK